MASVPAFEKNEPVFTVPAGSDLSSYQYCPVKYSSGSLAICSSLGEACIGILQNKPSAATRAGVVKFGNISKVTLGGSVSQNEALVAGSSGSVVAQSADDQFVIGIALSDGSSGERIPAAITMRGAYDYDGALQYKEVAVSSAEIKALYTTAKEIVPAPGAGYVNEFVSCVFILDYGTVDYATRGDITIHETNISGTMVSDTVAAADLVQQSADAIQVCQALSADTALTENAALVLCCATGNPAAGDSVIRVKCAYRVHATGL